ncbi:MAG: 4Fe-4S binding protein [Phycisphaerae bacterium]|nr:4Fe-4S binding protein [Phycisphaerae bacterium]
MTKSATVTIDGREFPINGERNLLEVIRKAGIEIPTFCYHSDLSVYGACRLCLVEVEGRGLVASCSTPAEPGLRVRTNTPEIREIRTIAVELLLANHDSSCPTCAKSNSCQLQALARRLGIEKVRFKPARRPASVDRSSPSLVRDPNKCVLCGDCVRVCSEIQGIGAIDFAFRGHSVSVLPAFGKNLDKVECVYCGQCAAVCPTGAITPRSEVEDVWRAIDNPAKKVVAQIAPAVRVALGEAFGLAAGSVTTGLLTAALKAMGFDRVYDTCFTADLTVIEEGSEFIRRATTGGAMPQFTSCCPGWVKFAEQYYPDLLENLSSCRSPQQMFGALAKDMLPKDLGVEPKDLIIVSIMPCTAKKFEAKRPEFTVAGVPQVDHVLTTQEVARMIQQYGVRFNELKPESLDLPLGFKTGAGVIFGASGGVTEAVLRFAAEQLGETQPDAVEFLEVRGEKGLREAEYTLGGKTIRLAVVHGLANARKVAEEIRAGNCQYDLIEVMACPGGCIGGAGQPVALDSQTRRKRTEGLYETDKMLQLHKSQDNPYVKKCYEQHLGQVGGEKAHHLLHTHYQNRRRISGEDLALLNGGREKKLQVSVCVGTSCYLRGSQDLLHALIRHIEERGLHDRVDVQATFCFERCGRGPTVRIGEQIIEKCRFDHACQALDAELAAAGGGGS